MKKCTTGLMACALMLTMVMMTVPALAAQGKTLLMATTTSTDNTGLLDY